MVKCNKLHKTGYKLETKLNVFDADLPGRVALLSLDNQHAIAGQIGGDALWPRGHSVVPLEGPLHDVQAILRLFLMLPLDGEHAVVVAHVEFVGAVVGSVQGNLKLMFIVLYTDDLMVLLLEEVGGREVLAEEGNHVATREHPAVLVLLQSARSGNGFISLLPALQHNVIPHASHLPTE